MSSTKPTRIPPGTSALPGRPTYGEAFRFNQVSLALGLTFGITPSAVLSMPEVSPGAKVLYAVISGWAATQAEVRPSMARLAADAAVSPKQARRYVEELKKAGLLRVTRRSVPGKPGLNDSNLYELLYHPVFDGKRPQILPETSVLPNLGVLPDVSNRYSQIWESSNTNEKEHIREAAVRIHQNHPGVRRDLGIDGIGKKLAAIQNLKRLRGPEAERYIRSLADRHEKWCQTEQWQKDCGQFAKGLENWLAPTKDRYELDPPRPLQQTSTEHRGLSIEELLRP